MEHSKNCTITIVQKFSDYKTASIYTLDDYRVAQAIANILDNVSHVSKDYYNSKGSI